jgi:hypothetical protein
MIEDVLEGTMEITLDELAKYLTRLDPLIGDRRTKRTVQGVVSGIIAVNRRSLVALVIYDFRSIIPNPHVWDWSKASNTQSLLCKANRKLLYTNRLCV